MDENIKIADTFSPIRRGLLELAVLRIVAHGEVYAADILKLLAGTELSTQEGTLYPLLSRMRREGWLDYAWQESEQGPPRKYYRLAPPGRERLAQAQKYWHTIIKNISNL